MVSENIRMAKADDADQICEIYNHYLLNTCITFEEEPVTVKEMQQRIAEIQQEYSWIVYEENNQILGYAYFSKWKVRSAYRFCVESTVYLKHGYEGKGLGTLLYKYLIELARKRNIHTLLGGITIPNDASIKLHEKMGFVKVAQLKEVGFKQNKWLDVGYWELMLYKKE
jgi:phosphinothricin acetyltransferase